MIVLYPIGIPGLYALLLFALISISQRRLAEIAISDAIADGEAPTPSGGPPFPVGPSGALQLMEPEAAVKAGARGASVWLLDAFAAHFGVAEAARHVSALR